MQGIGQPVNNAYAAQTDDGGGGGGGSLFALLCGPFCKGTPFEEVLGLNEQNQQPGGIVPYGEPITSQGETNNTFFAYFLSFHSTVSQHFFFFEFYF